MTTDVQPRRTNPARSTCDGWETDGVQRVVVVGRGGAGKSTLCRRLGEVTRLPAVELDAVYWDSELRVLTAEEWRDRQRAMVAEDRWIMDGDLGPYDVIEPRLERADTVVILDTPLVVCLWRAVRRGRQRRDFWIWVFRWRRTHLPQILASVGRSAPDATMVWLTGRQVTETWLADLPPAS